MNIRFICNVCAMIGRYKKMVKNFNGEKACRTATLCIGEEIQVRHDVFAGKMTVSVGCFFFFLNLAYCLSVWLLPSL